jgi:hypothetical protein
MNRSALLFVVVLAGCSASGDAAGPAAVRVVTHTPPIPFVQFQDPKENAFTVEVPKNWRVQGGLFRFASVDTRAAVELVSPEGDIRITSGDAGLPTFTLPNQTLTFSGFREGSWYSPGYGVRMIVRRYLPGAQFAEEYVHSRVAPAVGCSDLQITERKDRGELAQAVNALYRQLGSAVGGVTRLDMGEVRFTCTRGGASWQGYYLAGTLLMAMPSGGIWHVDHLVGYVSAKARAPLADVVLLHMLRGARQNPEWARMQSNITASTSRIVARTSEEISETVRKTFENRWKVEDEIMRKDTNARRGTTDLIDSATGETWNVQSGSRYYWRKPGGDTIVGTETYDAPGVGYEPLREY